MFYSDKGDFLEATYSSPVWPSTFFDFHWWKL